ncbi:MAG: hypothetical protein MI865_09040, partial [Proteobacteria bacterium]|nr:hypothetical protein [Pseudomonadota bacterium]
MASTLRSLAFSEDRVADCPPDASWQLLGSFTQLKRLEIRLDSDRHLAALCEVLKDMCTLTELRVMDREGNGRCLLARDLAAMTGLKSLCFRPVTEVDQLHSLFSWLPLLTRLDLGCSHVGCSLCCLTSVVHLRVHGERGESLEVGMTLRCMPKLEHLELHEVESQIPSSAFSAVTKLRTMLLTNPDIDNEFFLALSFLPDLTRLGLTFTTKRERMVSLLAQVTLLRNLRQLELGYIW